RTAGRGRPALRQARTPAATWLWDDPHAVIAAAVGDGAGVGEGLFGFLAERGRVGFGGGVAGGFDGGLGDGVGICDPVAFAADGGPGKVEGIFVHSGADDSEGGFGAGRIGAGEVLGVIALAVAIVIGVRVGNPLFGCPGVVTGSVANAVGDES